MQDPLKYFNVNWIDGMKINKDHFIELENSISDHIKDAISVGINKYNYGLLPPYFGKSSPVKIVLNLDNQQSLRAKIFECRAVTPGGARIEIVENDQNSNDFAVLFPETTFEINQLKQDDLLVALSVNPFKRIAIGNANPSEDPPRFPYTIPEYKVHLIAESQLGNTNMGNYFLILGKVRIKDNQPELIKEYIPPVNSLLSHPRLISAHTEFDKFFSQLELDIVGIMRKIKDKDQSNDLAKSVSAISNNLLNFLSENILEFRWKLPVQSPLFMFEMVGRCARVLRNSIDTQSGKAKEELLNYFTEWCSLNQGDFEKILLATINFQYDHNNISATLDIMAEFAEVISSLFSKLATLEYIGKKKDTSIFVKEQTVKKSFLAD
jgi:hypothetical protein